MIEPPPRVVTSLEALRSRVGIYQVVMVDGAPCSGYLDAARGLSDLWMGASYGELPAVPSQTTTRLPGNIDPSQSVFWVLDFVRQLQGQRFILAGSYLSLAINPSGFILRDERFDLFGSAMQELNAALVMVEPEVDDYRRLLAAEGRSAMWSLKVRAAYTAAAQDLPRDRVITYIPPAATRAPSPVTNPPAPDASFSEKKT